MCTDSKRFQPSPLLKLSCHLVFNLHFFYLKLEILSKKPAVVRIHRFGGPKMTRQIYEAFKNSTDVENQTVEGHQYSAGYRGRVADGLWLEHQEEIIRPLYSRLQKTLRINPAVAENFLILGYNVFGHYAPHYDHLHEMHRSYDGGWFEFYGNRMATALFIVQTAERGGGTVFPQLRLTIQPEKGDLLLWMNADSNDKREDDCLHAACPIEDGEKVAVSLWFRGNFQDDLQCDLRNERYNARDLIRDRKHHKRQLRFENRPPIELDDEDTDEYWTEQ
ncbi:Fe2OG dioxygenase domain-containing protein [Aphelenchoides besseyi]|nr:Fe2OG dioxygenase domain-containing protein [Aphelenchoides besseyi]